MHTESWRVPVVLVVALAMATAAGCQKATTPAAAERKDPWATSIDKPGCPNLHKVTDRVYRGAQPTSEGFRELKAMGIKTVVDLRALHSDRGLIEGTGLGYERIRTKAWHPEDDDVVRFLKIVSDPERTPVFVHCQHGSDRTGTMIAVYRIIACGWTRDEAVQEMTQGDFGFHEAWQNLVDYLEQLNVEDIRRRAGLQEGER